MSTSSSYVDPDAFTRLFRHRRKNFAQICVGLQQIVGKIASRFWFQQSSDRDDIESKALLYTIERIDRFSFAQGKNAFDYYIMVARNAIYRHLRDYSVKHRRALRFSDISVCSRDTKRIELHTEQRESDFWLYNATPYTRASK